MTLRHFIWPVRTVDEASLHPSDKDKAASKARALDRPLPVLTLLQKSTHNQMFVHPPTSIKAKQQTAMSLNSLALSSQAPVALFSSKHGAIGAIDFRLAAAQVNSSAYIVSTGPVEAALLWSSDESAAGVKQIEFAELPVDASYTAVGSEEAPDEAQSVYPSFNQRLLPQVHGLISRAALLLTMDWLRPYLTSHSQVQSKHATQLTQDTFGFRKLVLLRTDIGAVHALDCADGRTVWKRHFELKQQQKLQQMTVIGPTRLLVVVNEGDKSIVYTLNVHTGYLVSTEHTDKIERVALLPFTDPVSLLHLHAFYTADRVIVKPDTNSVRDILKQTDFVFDWFTHRIDIERGLVTGFKLQVVSDSPTAPLHFTLRPVWSFNLHSSFTSELIAAHAHRSALESVPSSLRVLPAGITPQSPERLLRKELNPNIVSIITVRRSDNNGTLPLVGAVRRAPQTPVVTLYLLDTVTGSVIDKIQHAQCIGPVALVMTENSAVYAYHSLVHGSSELTVADMWSSSEAETPTMLKLVADSMFATQEGELQSFKHSQPVVTQQSYLFKRPVRSLSLSLSRRGVARKLILALTGSTASGVSADADAAQLVSLPRELLDSLRSSDAKAVAMEGAPPPYSGDLPFDSRFGILSANRSLSGASIISSSAPLLESASLVVVSGSHSTLFMRCTTSAATPFDQLSPDFNRPLLASTIAVLIVLIVISRQMARRKLLLQAWK